jgi:hypothetical protein
MLDAGSAISTDWRFGIAYNAALKLCTVLLYAEGYRASRELQHYRTLAALPEILGEAKKADAEYLDDCRKKRNIVEYDYVGRVSKSDADELIVFVKEFRDEVVTRSFSRNDLSLAGIVSPLTPDALFTRRSGFAQAGLPAEAASRRRALLVLRSPALQDIGGCSMQFVDGSI